MNQHTEALGIARAVAALTLEVQAEEESRSKSKRICGGCQKDLTNDKQAKQCSQCKKEFYCSLECAKINWATHKLECKIKRGNKPTCGPSVFTRDVNALKAVVQGMPMLATTPLICDNLTCRRSFGAQSRSDLEWPLLRCSKCKTAVYCSAACAKACFASHKKGCGVLQEFRSFRAGGGGGLATVRVVESCVMAKRTLSLLNLGDEIAYLECEDWSDEKAAELDAKLLQLPPTTTIFLIYKHTGIHRKNERKYFDRGLSVFQCDLPATTPPSVVNSSIFKDLTHRALAYMYAEEDRLCGTRYFQHGGGAGMFNPFQMRFPHPPGMAAMQGGRVDEQSNITDLGFWSGLQSNCVAFMGPGNMTPFRWETDGPFNLPEMSRVDILLSKIHIHVPAAMPEGVLVLVSETIA